MAQENKQQLQVMGERLARSSQDSKAAEIQHKLSKVSERWQHLLDLIAARWVYKTLKTMCECRLMQEIVWFLSEGEEKTGKLEKGRNQIKSISNITCIARCFLKCIKMMVQGRK